MGPASLDLFNRQFHAEAMAEKVEQVYEAVHEWSAHEREMMQKNYFLALLLTVPCRPLSGARIVQQEA